MKEFLKNKAEALRNMISDYADHSEWEDCLRCENDAAFCEQLMEEYEEWLTELETK